MQNTHNSTQLPVERIESKIFLIRGKRVMIDRDLAELYGVKTMVLNQAVRRNKDRFPQDFMFQMSKQEMENWKSQIVTSNSEAASRSQFVILKRGHNIKYAPLVFTEQGVAMLSSVLRSKRAVQVNIQIMRTFTKLREMLATNKELREKIEALEKKYDNQFKVVFQAIKQLVSEEVKPAHTIGFRTGD